MQDYDINKIKLKNAKAPKRKKAAEVSTSVDSAQHKTHNKKARIATRAKVVSQDEFDKIADVANPATKKVKRKAKKKGVKKTTPHSARKVATGARIVTQSEFNKLDSSGKNRESDIRETDTQTEKDLPFMEEAEKEYQEIISLLSQALLRAQNLPIENIYELLNYIAPHHQSLKNKVAGRGLRKVFVSFAASDKEALAELITDKVAEEGISLSKLAQRADFAKSNLSYIVNKTGNPKIETLVKIAEAINMDMDISFTPKT